METLKVPEHLCFHCFLDVPKQSNFSVVIDEQIRVMCCPGCAAVAQTIVDSGLQNYYRHRTGEPVAETKNSQEQLAKIQAELTLYNNDNVQKEFVAQLEQGEKEATFVIEGITCAACVWLLEHHIAKQPGIVSASVNMSNHRAQIRWRAADIELSTILTEIYQIGYRGHPYRPDVEEQLLAKEQKKAIRRLGIAGVGMMQVVTLAIALYAGAFNSIDANTENLIRWSSLIIATPIVLYAALPFFLAAYRDIKTRHLSMDVPVSIAIGAAYIASAWATWSFSGEIYFDSVTMFTFFLLFGRYLEMQARHRTGRAGNALLNLLPTSATLVATDSAGTTTESMISAAELNANDLIIVLPGETIPADGVIQQGCSSVDESAFTGEYLPKRREIDDLVIGGTLNVESPLTILVTHVGAQTQLSAIVLLLDRAQQEKPNVAKIADTVANYFVACVLISAVIVSVTWWNIEPENAFWITLSVLVVTCPCALSLATPTALTTATGTLRQMGLLITRGHVLESLADVTDIVFDKTGTLTEGNLSIEKTIVLSKQTQTESLALAAALEAHSEHPIAKAFSSFATSTAEQSQVTLGQGIQGVIDGLSYRIGKPDFATAILNSSEAPPPPSEDGHWLLLSSVDEAIAWFLISDTLRADAKKCIQTLQTMDINVHMLTGDSSSAVQEVASQLNIQQVCSNTSPEEKLSYIRKLQQAGCKLVMVGDGINDLPVLAGAQTSIAMGSASDLAKTHADAVLTNGELYCLNEAIFLAKKTRRIIKQNIFWAFAYNMTALPLAAFGLIPPYLAAIGMSASSLVVVTNALRLSKVKKNRRSNSN